MRTCLDSFRDVLLRHLDDEVSLKYFTAVPAHLYHFLDPLSRSSWHQLEEIFHIGGNRKHRDLSIAHRFAPEVRSMGLVVCTSFDVG